MARINFISSIYIGERFIDQFMVMDIYLIDVYYSYKSKIFGYVSASSVTSQLYHSPGPIRSAIQEGKWDKQILEIHIICLFGMFSVY